MRNQAENFAGAAARILIVVLAAALFAGHAGIARAAQYAGIVIDAKTGKTLYGHRADERQAPASLTKMMTLYMLFEAMEAGKVKKTSRITMSKRASGMAPSKLGIPAGGSLTAEQAILALVTKSANDVAAAVAEHLGGTEYKFAKMMTEQARSLGMKSTTFATASGLPASGQLTTARDMARLGTALREHFPQYYGYFSTRTFTYGKQRMGNHNRLLGQVKGMDGIKTGYTRAAGFNLVTSVERDGRSIVAVVLGGKSGKSRNQQMASLIQKYLPKASRGEDKMVVARAGGSMVMASLAELPDRGPLPAFRPRAEDPVGNRILTAHIVSASTMQVGAERSAKDAASVDIATIQRRLREMKAHSLPVPTPASATDPIVTASSKRRETAATLAYLPEPKADPTELAIAPGWQIQIGATSSRESAVDLLQKARSKAPDILSQVPYHTETIEKGDDVLYRARFAGFSSKKAAWAACGTLKKQKFACIALAY